MDRNDEQHLDDAPTFSEDVLESKMDQPEECCVCGTETDDPVVFVLTMCQDHGALVSEHGMNLSG